MGDKLTLRLDKDLILGAKRYAKSSGKSVSAIVADLFEFIRNEALEDVPDDYPATASLRGILKDKSLTVQDYHDHLEQKNL